MKKGFKQKRLLSILLLVFMLANFISPAIVAAGTKKKVTARPMVVMMEFPDYKFSEIDEKEDWRLREIAGEEFTRDFVQDMLFSPDTYEEDGHEFISLRNYYNQLTGGTYDLDGQVFGPYTAKNEARFYGSSEVWSNDKQEGARELVIEAIEHLAAEEGLDFADFDLETRERDKDANETYITYNRPDGQVDTIIVIHAGIGENFGGGSLGSDAIWPFRRGFTWYGGSWNLKEYKTKDHKGEEWRFDDFAIIAQDAPGDMLNHEFGHVLGLPDLYGFWTPEIEDFSTPPVQKWDIMGGSYTGKDIQGTMPVGYGAWSREYLQKSFEEGDAPYVKWANMEEMLFDQLGEDGLEFELHQAHERVDGKTDLYRISLPDEKQHITNPASGKHMYFSGEGKGLSSGKILGLKNSMKTDLDLKDYDKVKLEFKTWYKIDDLNDFASVRVREKGQEDWETVEGNITTEDVDQWLVDWLEYDKEQGVDSGAAEAIEKRNPGHGITGDSEGWVDAEFDLSAYAGKEIELKFYFVTDNNTPEIGIFVDDIVVKGLKEEVEAKEEAKEVEEIEETEEVEEVEELEELEKVEEIEEGEETEQVEKVEEEEVEIEKGEKGQEAVEAEVSKGNDWEIILIDDVEGEPKFELDGFEVSDGNRYVEHYYLLEWRNAEEGKVDEGLAYPAPWYPDMKYESGLLVWYVNTGRMDDWGGPNQQSGATPGKVFAGVIDADQNPITYYKKGEVKDDTGMDFIMHDAAFGLKEENDFYYAWAKDTYVIDESKAMVPDFDDSKDYSNANPQGAMTLEDYGVKVLVLEQDKDNRFGKIRVMNSKLDNKEVDYSNGLNVSDIRFTDDSIIVEANYKGHNRNLARTAYIGFIAKDEEGKIVETKTRLELKNGVYVGDLDFMKEAPKADYQVNFVVLEDKDGNARGIYNSKTHSGYGTDLSMGDYSNHHLEPEAILSRGEFVEILVEELGIDLIETNQVFNDLDEDHKNFKSVNTAASLGIVTGDERGNFAPDRMITREELAVMTARAINALDINLRNGKRLDAKDANFIAGWAKDEVSLLVGNRILSNEIGSFFMPLAHIKESQARKILQGLK